MQIEELEQLADSIVGDDRTAKEKQARLIRAYARILNVREPDKFPRMPLEKADEDGHWDNTYPPKIKYKNHAGPRLFEVITETVEARATSRGFYHGIAYATSDPGLSVGHDGVLYSCEQTGTGSFGQFAAHPGECNVCIEITYSPLSLDDIPLDRLQKAEKELRALAFPHVARVAPASRE